MIYLQNIQSTWESDDHNGVSIDERAKVFTLQTLFIVNIWSYQMYSFVSVSRLFDLTVHVSRSLSPNHNLIENSLFYEQLSKISQYVFFLIFKSKLNRVLKGKLIELDVRYLEFNYHNFRWTFYWDRKLIESCVDRRCNECFVWSFG